MRVSEPLLRWWCVRRLCEHADEKAGPGSEDQSLSDCCFREGGAVGAGGASGAGMVCDDSSGHPVDGRYSSSGLSTGNGG